MSLRFSSSSCVVGRLLVLVLVLADDGGADDDGDDDGDYDSDDDGESDDDGDDGRVKE